MSTLLQQIRARTLNTGAPPSICEIEEMANFRQKGGLTRCLGALREVAAERVPTTGPLPVDAIIKGLMAKCDVVDDGEDAPMLCATEAELREALAALRP